MKRALLILGIVALTASAAWGGVIGTSHDLKANEPNSQVCIFCHTPHNATPAVPLWNHTLSAATGYTEYTSSTLDAASAGTLLGGTGISNLCLSCHDGTVGLGSLVNNGPGGAPTNAATIIGAGGLLSTDLSNDHPINILYTATLANTTDGELVDPTTITTLDLFGTNDDELQCASCHDPHDDTNQPFLVVSNASSGLCLTCHIK